MQSKKRAKAVKFGTTAKDTKAKEKKTEESKKEVEKEVKEITTEKGSAKDKSGKENHPPNGLEAHFSSRIETIDITEVSDDSSESEDASDTKEDQKQTVPQSATQPPMSAGVTAAGGIDTESTEDDAKEENKNTQTDDVSTEEDIPLTTENKSEKGDDEQDNDPDQETEEESILNKDGAFSNVPSDAYDKKKSKLPFFLVVMIVTFFLGLVFFAGVYYSGSDKENIFSFLNKPTPEVTKEPEEAEPTEKPVDLSKYTIRVLNGTDTSGVAAKTRDELTNAGFEVISVGNAEEDDFVETEIAAAENVEQEYIDKLKETLSKSYKVGGITTLASGEADVVVTIGSASAK